MKIEIIKRSNPDMSVWYVVHKDDKPVMGYRPINAGTVDAPREEALLEAINQFNELKYAILHPESIFEVVKSEEI